MSKPIVVTIPHRLGKEEAKRRLQSGLGAARDRFGALLTVQDEAWTGDRLALRVGAMGQTASGMIDVGEDQVVLTVELPGLLGVFADTVRARLRKQTTLMLEKK